MGLYESEAVYLLIIGPEEEKVSFREFLDDELVSGKRGNF